MRPGDDFFNLYNHEFVRVAVAVPAVRVADPAFNARQVSGLIAQAAERLSQERMRQTSFGQSIERERDRLRAFRRVSVRLPLPKRGRLLPERRYERFPYVPSDSERRDARCAEVYEIQVQGLVKRLEFTGLERVVIGVSGGLDSTQALLVCAQAMDVLGHPRSHVLAYMPGFATSRRTHEQARRLMSAIGVQAHGLDIRRSALQMLADIGHPFSRGERVYDVTFENVQAGERTSLLFRLANLHRALVVGTSDLSELALGWCTYGVGDHMSHYAVNASVPKTLIQHVIRWAAQTDRPGATAPRAHGPTSRRTRGTSIGSSTSRPTCVSSWSASSG